MAQDTITTPVAAILQTAARLSLAGAATFVVLFAALHVLKPELDPSWHFMREYAIGRHNLGGTLGPAMPVAAAIIGWSLARNQAWASARRPLIWAMVLALLSFLVSFSSLSVMLAQHAGRFGPDVLVGWPNRLEMLAYSVWLTVVAWHAAQLPQQRPAGGDDRG
jgi:hypothetical protein